MLFHETCKAPFISITDEVNVSAKITYKISNGKLINAKTKKIVKGYNVYKKKLYYNGSLKRGYKVYRKKLYYNGSLKKGYKTSNTKLYKNGSLFTGTYKDIFYESGEKFTGYIGEKQYENGKVVEEDPPEVISID